MDDLMQMLSDAVAGQNWPVVVVLAVLVVLSLVAVVLKMLGKDVPILDKLLDLGKGIVKMLPAKKEPPPVEPDKDGVSNVVPIRDDSQKP